MKEIIEFSRIFLFVKTKTSKLINYSTNICWSYPRYYGNHYVYEQGSCTLLVHFVGLALVGKDIVFRFIIEYIVA
jgi:hypothetical protein